MPLFFRLLSYCRFEPAVFRMNGFIATFSVLCLLAELFPLQAQNFSLGDDYLRQIVQTQEVIGSMSDRSNHYLFKLNPGIKKADLANTGIKILRALGQDLFVGEAKTDIREQTSALFERIRPVNPLWKLAPHLLIMEKFHKQHFIIEVLSVTSVLKSLQGFEGIKVIRNTNDIVEVYTTLNDIINKVIILEEVIYVGIESHVPNVDSRVLELYLGPNRVNKVHDSLPELNGAGSVISIRELQYNTADIDLQGRHHPSDLSSNEISSHATDMATIAAGAGNSFITGKGVAWGATITSSDFSELFPDADDKYTELNAWTQNHAYGTVIENFYGVLAEAYDRSTNHLPELLHVFSSGNQGAATSDHGDYSGIPGVSNLTGNFKMAKNILTVGAVDTVGRPTDFSSRGPACDGRVKPELVAYSTQGSSNAAAIVSGVGLLLQQAFKEKERVLPPSALIKSLLINSARDAGPTGLDFITGYGNVDAYRAINNLREEKYLSESIGHGEIKTFSLSLPANAKNLKVTLVWNDPAAQANTGIALVNDLDMRIQHGEIWLPWVLDATADKNKLALPAKRSADHLNNIEQITIEDPAGGIYSITIEGYDIPVGIQDFYISYQWDNGEHFEWTFPSSSDNMPYDGETATYFFWNSTLVSPTGRIEYTIDKGRTWKVIANDVELKRGYYRWSDIPQITALAQARFVINNVNYPTAHFTISQPLSISMGFNCTDSLMFQWPALSGVSTYGVYTLNDKYAEQIATTADTFYTSKKSINSARHYAVQPILADGKSALRSPLFDYEQLGTGCYLLSFVDELVPDEGIYLIVQLGTTYGIDRLIIEHEINGVFVPITEINPQAQNIRYLHSSPHQGLNRYRVIIKFVNGQQLVSQIIEDYFLTTLPFIVFPNPVSSAGGINIYSKTFAVQDVTLRLYKADGTLVKMYKLMSDREFLSLGNLSPGLYLFTITSEAGRFNGKIVIH